MRFALFGLLALALAPACTITTAGTCGCVTPSHSHAHATGAERPRTVRVVEPNVVHRPSYHPSPGAPQKQDRPKRPRVARVQVSRDNVKAEAPRPRAEQLAAEKPTKRPISRSEPQPVVSTPAAEQAEPNPATRPDPRPSARPDVPIADLPLRRSPERHPKPELPPQHNEPVLSR